MKAALLVALLAMGGCTPDVCAPFDGQACIALEVTGAPTITIDQLAISIDKILPRELTPVPPLTTPASLPVWVAVLPGELLPSEKFNIFVDALRGGALVGQALGDLQMRPGQHLAAAITLTDLMPATDMAGADFSGADLRAVDMAKSSSPALFAANNGLFGGEIDAILTDFAQGSAYIGTGGGGVFKTSNSGASWSAANSGMDLPFVSTLVSDNITGTIYARGSRRDGTNSIFKSVNAGQSWTKVVDSAAGGPVLPTTDSLANPVLFIGGESGILRSTDGVNFTAKNTGLTNISVLSLVADPLTKGTIYAGTGNQKVFQTTNFGDSWSDVSTGISSAGSLGTRALEFDPHTEDLVAVTGAGLFTRLLGQTTFSAYSPTPPAVDPRALAFVQSSSPDLYVVGFPGVFHLDGNKTAWTNASAGITDQNLVSVAIDRSQSSLIYAGTLFGGLFVSSNSATSWSPGNQGITNLSMISVAVDPQNSQIVYGGSQHAGAFRSSNGGTTWQPINNGLPVGAGISFIVVNPGASSTLFLATLDTSASGITQALFRSLDSGSSWTQVDPNQTTALLIDPNDFMVVYAGGSAGAVRKSSTNGNSFGATGSLPSFVSSLVADPTNSQILYASTLSNGVFRSGNSGATWTQSTSGISETQINCLAIDSVTPTRLWAAGFQSLYRSSDAGGSWVLASSGTFGQAFNAIRRSQSALYTSSTGGTYRSPDGVTWFKFSDLQAHDLAVDPTNSNIAYFAEIGGVGITKTLTGGL